ncbi:MAG TPA: response regulator, partial [Terracidiphilus sp.]|nr:response regulator [Terracidiphilus sp.]
DASGEVAALKDNINEMIRNLKDTTIKNNEQDWLKTNLAKFTRMLQGQKDMLTVGKLILSELAPVVSAQHGVFYVMETPKEENIDDPEHNEPYLKLLASYAFRNRKNVGNQFALGEGLVGQAALEKERILITNAPDDYVQITSGLGQAPPTNIIVLPVLFEGQVKAVMELSSFEKFSAVHQAFLDQLVESIGIVLNTIEANTRTEDLLKQSQSLAKELQSRQEELQKTNLELQDKAKLLAEQNAEVERKNTEVEQARQALEEKAEQLALTSKYKSEFLANMSHELRTPLNSLLILAKLLADNSGDNLTTKQIEYAQTIHGAGTDLLSLINDILDLAKIESGTVTLNITSEPFSELQDYVERTFRLIAQGKKLGFSVTVDQGTPATILTDIKRLQQILKNLLSNAFKFTDHGKVSLRIAPAKSGWTRGHAQLDAAGAAVAFTVTDSGIGIPEQKQKIIFEAFQQADGTTSRQYGGTGLGLSISRELTRLLGGEIQVISNTGKGSTFTLYLPLIHKAPDSVDEVLPRPRPTPEPDTSMSIPAPADIPHRADALKPNFPHRIQPAIRDDRDNISSGERVVLIVEDDAKFAGILLDLIHEYQFKGIVALDGSAALASVKEFMPDAITLDLKLPDMDGWAVLDYLKHDPATRHIPVSVISVDDEMRGCLQMGALGFVQKPAPAETLREVLLKTRKFIERDVKTLLVIHEDAWQRDNIISTVEGDDIQIASADSGKEAINVLRQRRFDCIVLGATRDISALSLLKKLVRIEHAAGVPIVMYGPDGFSESDQEDLKKLSDVVILKKARSIDAVLQETTLFLHRMVDSMPPKKREVLANLQKTTPELRGKKVLIVDDDIRNIFAMAGALEQHGMSIVHAENGKDGIELLEVNPDVDIVLMDIMMPELDGYDTMRIIRGLEEFKNLPIIAVTAKAMKGDREKCVEAGASDYISKPVNIEQLLSLLRVWLVS